MSCFSRIHIHCQGKIDQTIKKRKKIFVNCEIYQQGLNSGRIFGIGIGIGMFFFQLLNGNL